MKGLIIKDIKLISQNIKYIILIMVIAAVVFLNQPTSNFIFIYVTIVFSLLSLNTLAYDESDKSIVFLMTLPVSRASYVKGKYILSFTFSLLGGICAFAIGFVIYPNQSFDILLEGISIYVTMLIFNMIMIPMRLKFGSEKSGTMLFIFAFLIFAVFGVAGKIISRSGINMPVQLNKLNNLIERFMTMNEMLLAAVLCLFIVVCFAISFTISLRIMQKKEF
ncbi:MAG: ABC-2 transporter permease [Clostridiales bacterium]|nr:ABC-2 transporter permease [Clostridiales bacterium]